MNTNETVIQKVKTWLNEEDKSYQWLADQLSVSKSLVGHMLSGERALKPERIEQIASIMGVTVKDLVAMENQQKPLSVHLRGNTSSRRSKRKLDSLLYAIEDYISLTEKVNK